MYQSLCRTCHTAHVWSYQGVNNRHYLLKHYKDALLFELNYMNKQKCSCLGCHDKRKRIEKDLNVIFNIDTSSLNKDN